jgi:hypothetical protein
VDEGVPFCPHCSAPQIRVMLSEPLTAPRAAEAVAHDSAVPPVPETAFPLHWSQALKPCALAALAAALLMSLGLNPFVAMLSVGFLAVFFFRHRARGIAVKVATGAGIGALAGLLWFVMSSIFETVIVIALHKGPELHDAVLTKLQEASSQTTDPQLLAVFERFKSPAGIELLMVTGLIFAFLAAIVLGSLGGALGSAILGRRK